MSKQPCVYILTNKRNGTLYTGVTSDLAQRLEQHRTGGTGSFSDKYHTHLLVYFEAHETMETAIARERQLKGGSRKKKLDLIEADNPRWQDLSDLI